MSNSPAIDVATYLAGQGVGTYVAGGTIITGMIPTTPDTLIVIRDTPGYPAAYAMGTATPCMEYPSVQIAARAPTYAAAETLAWNAYHAIAASPSTMNGRHYLAITPMQTPFMLPRDETSTDGRAIFAFNVNLIREFA